MNHDLSKLKIEELIYLAQHVTYIKPNKKYQEWSEDEILFDAIYVGVSNQSQIDTIYMSCKILPPLKLLIKERLKKFIKNYIK